MTSPLVLTKFPGVPALPEWTPPPLGCFTGLVVTALMLGRILFWVVGS